MKRLVSGFLFLALLLILPVCASADLMNVGGVLKYYDEHGREAEHIGLDLSYYNNQVDFQALSDQGFDFVLIRLGGRGWGASGRLYGDSKTQTFLRQAHEAGFRVGAYFYSTAVNATEVLEEAASAIATLNGFQLDLPIYIDMEYSGDYPNGRADGLTPSERSDIIAAFSSAVEAAGYRAGLYASEGYVRFDLDYKTVSYLPLWMASYTVDNLLPQYINDYEIWQQTDTTYAGGVDGPFDLDVMISVS